MAATGQQLSSRGARDARGQKQSPTGIFQKTRLCRYFEVGGMCYHGSACKFAHGLSELRAQPDWYRTRLCMDFLRTGSCPAGLDCRFAHGEQELRSSGIVLADRRRQIEEDPCYKRYVWVRVCVCAVVH